MSKNHDRKLECPFCRREKKKRVFIVKPSNLEVGAYCPECPAEVIDDGGNLYVKRPGSEERLPIREPARKEISDV